MSEKVYDEEVAPLLLEAGRICERNGMPIVARVQYGPDDVGDTCFLGESPSYATQLVYWAIQVKGNLDMLMMLASRHADQHGHNSVFLASLGEATGKAVTQ